MRIKNENDLTECVEHYGILRFWDETRLAASTLSDISFMKLWNVRERAVNSERVAYGKFVLKKAAFVALDVLPYLVSLRRNGYDFDEIAARFGMSESAVRVALSRARKSIRNIYRTRYGQ